MRDDRSKWTPTNSTAWPLELTGAVLSPAELTRQTLVSGADVLTQSAVAVFGWPEVVKGAPYALSLRRDRILVVGGPEMTEGWDPQMCQARSDASDAYAVFDLVGPCAFEILKRGAELSLTVASQSATRLIFGLPIIVYRFRTADGFRLHASACHAEALIGHLKAAASEVASSQE